MDTRTKIVATLGPASWDEPMLSRLIETGVDVFRINCSHADHEAIRRQVSRVRRAAMLLRRPVGILLDLQGPKIRTGRVAQPLELAEGDVLTIVMDLEYPAAGQRVGTTYPQMADDVSPGDTVLFADGALCGTVSAVRRDLQPAEVDVRIEDGGELGSFKGINLPGVAMSVPSMTDKDLADVAVGVEVGVDWVALSFVRSADDVKVLRRELERLGAPELPIVAKIEKPQAVDHIDDIVAVSDAVMVARGDLGVEVSIERVPVYQKRIIKAAFRANKLCITATQMLDSMERNPRPTRAETTDVANAILDGTDAVMLSGETAMGRYPMEAVRTMDRIAKAVEGSEFFRPTPLARLPVPVGPSSVIVHAASSVITERARPLVVFTWSGETAVSVSKARPPGAIFALTSEPRVLDRLALVWGVTPVQVPPVRTVDELIRAGEHVLLTQGHVRKGDEVVILVGRFPVPGATNLMRVYCVGDG